MTKETDVPEGNDEGGVATEEQVVETPQEEEVELDPVEKLAADIGWVPQDKFKGKADDWKPADQFIKHGKDIQTGLARDLRDMRGQIDTITKTSAAILQERLANERAQLANQYQQAVEEGDPDKAWQVSNRLHSINQQEQQTQAPTVSPESHDWVAQRPWFRDDPLARQAAVQVAEAYARDGRSTAEQLSAADREVRRLFPHHFNAGGRQAPEVSQPGSRSSSQSNRAKTAADMPRNAMEVARSFVESGSLKSVDEYAKFYWENEGKAR